MAKPNRKQREEEMYICTKEQCFSAEWMGIVCFDLGVVIKLKKILDKEYLPKLYNGKI